MNIFPDFLSVTWLDVVDVLMVAFFAYMVYKLLRGTAAINILLGIIVLYVIYWFTSLVHLKMFSRILGALLGAGVVGLMIVFQQEIRKFLLLMGSSKVTNSRSFFKQFRLIKADTHTSNDVATIVHACYNLSKIRTGALIVIERTNNLDFVTHTGDKMNAQVSIPLLESIFFKNSPLHDGAVIIKDNYIKAARIVLPVSNKTLPKRFGLRHKAAVGITEKTDAVCLVVSEETGKISYISDGDFISFSSENELVEKLTTDLS